MRGILLRGLGGFYTVLGEDTGTYTVRAQNKIRREKLRPKVGDRVTFEPGQGDDEGWIVRIEPRKNELTRPPVANVDALVIVLSAGVPQADLMLADKLMMNARRARIAPMLVVTKADLNPDWAQDLQRQYRSADVAPMCVSSVTGEGLGALEQRLEGRVCALAGQSGAGKSTLLNALYGLNLETGGLSKKIDRGRNTTRRCELLPVRGGGMVLDTPGFSLLEHDTFDPIEMKTFWPEFARYEGACYFQPCYHDREPRCAVLDAVARDEIDPKRHERYQTLLEEMKQQWRNRYD